ncbi:MAG: lipoyl(octanoyl) transferase LipB [Planctomycetes bacterium]|nr:lipoyl(octanoyl) transferase LipB [Planctomycetota bacterium]
MEHQASDKRYPEGVLEVRRLPRTGFGEVHELQRALVEQRLRGEIGDVLLLVEHEPVITLGRGTQRGDVSQARLPIFEVERGGEATYHGPGQLVAYPILLLREGRRDLHRYLRDLEEVVLRVLCEFDVVGTRRPGLTGVWIGERKVCSIGVSVRRWVTWHGLALNLDVDLGEYAQFRPCGLDATVMANVRDFVELPPTRLLFEVLVVKHLCEVFALELPPIPPPPAPAPGELPLYPG